MNILTIFPAVLSLGFMAFVFGMGLTVAEKKFKVEEDPRLTEILDVLPSSNCGACGLPGCGNFAQAVLRGEAGPSDCPVGGNSVAQAIGAVLGVKVKESVQQVAYIKCGGNENTTNFQYKYSGMADCNAVMTLAAGGPKSCTFGCLGGGSCIASFDFDAIIIKEGIAQVDKNKCTACGKCIPECPKKLITMVPAESKIHVACNANDEARIVRANCKIGCINCKLCEKACDYDAIQVYHLLAEINYAKCTNCGDCVDVCPTKCFAN